jgi:predicted permease
MPLGIVIIFGFIGFILIMSIGVIIGAWLKNERRQTGIRSGREIRC